MTESAGTVLDAAPTIPGEHWSRVALTPAAADLLTDLVAAHGRLMFHQSGGCCEGSAPMCLPEGEFLTSEADVLLGRFELSLPAEIGEGRTSDVDFWMSATQFEYWKYVHLTIDAVPGRGGGFSIESPTGKRFIIRPELREEAQVAQAI